MVLKLWDPRKPDPTRTYNHHVDFISDFLWLADKKHLVVTRFVIRTPLHNYSNYPPKTLSGDGTLSVLDVRSNKQTPFAQSEDQEDELLSIVSIKGFGQDLHTKIHLLIFYIEVQKWLWALN
jgi:WD repeat-containing protein 55